MPEGQVTPAAADPTQEEQAIQDLATLPADIALQAILAEPATAAAVEGQAMGNLIAATDPPRPQLPPQHTEVPTLDQQEWLDPLTSTLQEPQGWPTDTTLLTTELPTTWPTTLTISTATQEAESPATMQEPAFHTTIECTEEVAAVLLEALLV